MVVTIARFVVGALQILMFVRAILSWIPLGEDNPIEVFVYTVTEPIVMPVRAVLNYFGLFEGLPIDIASLITIVLLTVIEMLISL